MRLYLSSYRLGNQADKLASYFPETNKHIAYIPNARDFSYADPERRQRECEYDMKLLEELSLIPELLDLKLYFGNKNALREVLRKYQGVFVGGGNTFVLRQAMKLSGLDELLSEELAAQNDFVYAGYSAAGCVLSPSLDTYCIVDDSKDLPYPEQRETIWEGLGLIDYAFMPHFESDHPESADVAKEVELCKQRGIKYRTLRDGEVILARA